MLGARQPEGFRQAKALTPPITLQQVQEFKPGCFAQDTGSPNEARNSSLGAVVSSAFEGLLPAFVLPDFTSYYGDVHPDSLLPDGIGVMIFKRDASGIGSPFEGTFPPPREHLSRSPAAGGGVASKKQFDEQAKRRRTLLQALTTAFVAGDRYGGFWRNGVFEGEGVLITSTFSYQGSFSEGKPHGKGNMKFSKAFVDRMPPAEGGDGDDGNGGSGGGGIGAFLLKGLTAALLAPIPDALLIGGGGGGGHSSKPKEYLGDFDRRFLRHGHGLMKYVNGDIYEGEWKLNRRDGNGRFVSAETGEQYEGSWCRDERHGYGKVVYPDGSYFKGLFDHDVRSGEGLLLLPNGDEYYGNFERNRRQGEGTMRFKNGDVYKGSWKDGMRHGSGMYVLKKRNITVRGVFVKGLMEGEGVVEYPDTGVFAGAYERGERRRGTMIWFTEAEMREQRRRSQSTSAAPRPAPSQSQGGGSPGDGDGDDDDDDGDAHPSESPSGPQASLPFVEDPRRCYQGEWAGENMHGKGLLWYKDGSFFSGHFVKNARQGPGNLRYAGVRGEAATAAREYSGEFHADMRHGPGIEQSPDGSVKAGRWECDAFAEGYEGEWDSHSLNGVGRLRIPLASFFRGSGHPTESSRLPPPSSSSSALAAVAPPMLLPSLSSFLRENGGGSGEPLLSVFSHPAQKEGYASAKAAWLTAVNAAQELNDLYMVEFFGIFRDGRRDGSGVLRLPYMCERAPPSPSAEGEPAPRERETTMAEPSAKGASPLFHRGKQSRQVKKANPVEEKGAEEEEEEGKGEGEALRGGVERHLPPPPTLLLRRHVIKGKWEGNALDCARGVWSFPTGETYVGAFMGNARHQPMPSRPNKGSGSGARDSPSLSAKGLLFFPDGSVFMGRWHRNAPQGKGIFLCKNAQSPVFERFVERLGDDGRPAPSSLPLSSKERASRRRRDLRRSLSRRAADVDGEEELPLDEGGGRVERRSAHAAPQVPPPGSFTSGSARGVDLALRLFTGSAGTSDDEDADEDGAEATGVPLQGGGKVKERVRRLLTGYEDHYYLIGHWYQGSEDGTTTGHLADGQGLPMPFLEYSKTIAPRLASFPSAAHQRMPCFENTTMADASVGFHPPPSEIAAHLASPYAPPPSKDGGGNANHSHDASGNPAAQAPGGGVPESGRPQGSAATQYEDFYRSLLPRETLPGGAAAAAAAGAGAGVTNPAAVARLPMQRPPQPDTVNIARVSGEGVYVHPSTGVCVQCFFLDSMPRLAVPYRPGSDFDRYLSQLKIHYAVQRRSSFALLPSECSDYAYLLNHLSCLSHGEEFSPPNAIVSLDSDEEDDEGGGPPKEGPQGGSPPPPPAPQQQQQQQRRHDDPGADDGGSGAAVKGIGVGHTRAVGPLPFAAPSALMARRPSDGGQSGRPAPLRPPEPLGVCSLCGKGYSFFRESSCCTLCFRSCCSSCLNDYEILSTAGSSRSLVEGLSTRAATGYTEVSALLASSYHLLQKLKKGPDAFAEWERRYSRGGGGGGGGRRSPSLEVTSKQLQVLLSGTAALPVCADCVRCTLMHVQKQVQWIPLKLFSSVLAFESEGKLERAQARAAARQRRKHRRRHRPVGHAGAVVSAAAEHEGTQGAAVAAAAGGGGRGEEEAAATDGGAPLPLPVSAARLRSESNRVGDGGAIEEGEEDLPDASTAEVPPSARRTPKEGAVAASSEAEAEGGVLGEGALPPPRLHTPMGKAEATSDSSSQRPSPQPLPLPPPSPSPPASAVHKDSRLSKEPHEDMGSEGYAVYRGYTSRGIPHLWGEMWWWPETKARGLHRSLFASTARSVPADAPPTPPRGPAADTESAAESESCDDDGARGDLGWDARCSVGVRVLDLSEGTRRRRCRHSAAKTKAACAHTSAATAAQALLSIADLGSPVPTTTTAAAAPRSSRSHEARQHQQQQRLRYYYTGSFAHGKRSGHGTVIFENGEKYIGVFRGNAMHGEGFYFCDDGAVVHGEWRRNKLFRVFYIGEVEEGSLSRCGLGICFYHAVHQSRSIFFGGNDASPAGGSDDGEGANTARQRNSNNKSSSSGAKSPSTVPLGSGTQPSSSLYIDGEADASGWFANAASTRSAPSAYHMYNGQWRDGMKEGYGTLWRKDGVTYTGGFHKDCIDGRGVLTTRSSAFYGEFHEDMKSGHGVEFFFDVRSNRRNPNPRRSEREKTENGAATPCVSTVVEGMWRRDVSDGFVRIYQKKRKPARAPPATPSPAPESPEAEAEAEAEGMACFELTQTTYWCGSEKDDCFAPPLMEGDADRDGCALCERSFHLFFRRHHCRLCGKLICDGCSQKRARLPNHFYVSDEEKKCFQERMRQDALRAAAAPLSSAARPVSDSDDDDDDDDKKKVEEEKERGREGAGEGNEASPLLSAPQRVCDHCFYRLEQRRTLVLRKYADNSVYCGGMSKGCWVSRGLYWRADGLFFVFDDDGRLLTGQPGEQQGPSSSSHNVSSTSPRKGVVLSSSVLQDASPTKSYIDNHPVLFSESSPTAQLDRFLLWWVTANTRCQLSLATLDFPQLRAYKLLFAHRRCGGDAAVSAPSWSPTRVNAEGGRANGPHSPRPCTVVLAGSPEAFILSAANLFPNPQSTPRRTLHEEQQQQQQGDLVIDARSLRVSADFKHWLTFPQPPPLPKPSQPNPQRAKFVSYRDAVRAQERCVGKSLPDPSVEAALLRAARYRASVLPPPPPYPFHRTTREKRPPQRGKDSDGESLTSDHAEEAGESSGSARWMLPAHQRPPALSSVDIPDDELLREVTKERVERFLPFLTPSQLRDEDKDSCPSGGAPLGDHHGGDMKLLACYNGRPLFPHSPPPPLFGKNEAVPWDHWCVHDVPTFDPTTLPRPGSRDPNDPQPQPPRAMTSESELYYGCPIAPVTVGTYGEIVENGKVCKVAELMVSRERQALRRAERRRPTAAHDDAAAERGSSTDSTTTTTSEGEEEEEERNPGSYGPELVDGVTMLSFAAEGSRDAETSRSQGAEALRGKREERGRREALQKLREQQQQQLSALLTIGQKERAWLPERFSGPFKLSFHSHGI